MLLLAGCTQAGDFEKANEFYDQGRFPEAKQIYERLVDSGTRSANLFHNLGNTDYRIGSTGRAILGYERALVLEPGHPEATANLKLLREQTHASTLDSPFAERALLRLGEDAWTIVGAVAAWIAIFSLVLLCTAAVRDRTVWWIGAVCGVALAAIAVIGVRLHLRDHALAIVTARDAEAHLAPAESAALAGIFPAGSRVRVLSERGPWIYCELPGDRRGWLAAGTLERVRPASS